MKKILSIALVGLLACGAFLPAAAVKESRP